MNILITGAKGFVGKNFTVALQEIKKANDCTHPLLLNNINDVYEYDINNSLEELDNFCKKANFVFNFAGVNRPKNSNEFMKGNFEFANTLLELLKKYNNKCPVMLSSSIHASLETNYKNSDYAKSKAEGEKLFFDYAKETNAKVYVYRFPNLFGKWCKPNYNSAVATFCNNIANDLDITISDRKNEIPLYYIDDLVQEMLKILEIELQKEKQNIFIKNEPITVEPVYKKNLGEIVDLLYEFNTNANTKMMSNIPKDSFETKLYSTFLSYLPERKMKYSFDMKKDDRGSFTEIIKTFDKGQFSINVSKPSVTKGQHFHNSKWELFIVVYGRALIQERKIGFDDNGKEFPLIEFEVSGDKIEAVHMLPGYTHNIINISDTEDLITIMWANEIFDEKHPDTFRENV